MPLSVSMRWRASMRSSLDTTSNPRVLRVVRLLALGAARRLLALVRSPARLGGRAPLEDRAGRVDLGELEPTLGSRGVDDKPVVVDRAQHPLMATLTVDLVVRLRRD